ncbi:MAG: hypothetical protein OCD02_10415 [Spirochaetaceae bacterium]
MTKKDEGFILVDTIIALLILSISLTSVYGLIIKTIDFELKLTDKVELIIDTIEDYDESLKNII